MCVSSHFIFYSPPRSAAPQVVVRFSDHIPEVRTSLDRASGKIMESGVVDDGAISWAATLQPMLKRSTPTIVILNV
jgi:hypothetical protein